MRPWIDRAMPRQRKIRKLIPLCRSLPARPIETPDEQVPPVLACLVVERDSTTTSDARPSWAEAPRRLRRRQSEWARASTQL